MNLFLFYMFRVIIAGTRHFNDYNMLREYADKKLSRQVALGKKIIILSGHCYGTDLLGEKFAQERKYDLEIYPAEWSRYGAAAGPRRNKQMAANAQALIAFWDGKSKGTKNMIEEAKKVGLLVAVKLYNNP